MIGRDLVVTRTGARFLGRRIPCAIGRGGITTEKKEGDGATPAGTFTLAGIDVFYRPDRVRMSYGTPLRTTFIWSDDVRDPRYNKRGTIFDTDGGRLSHERMWRSDPLYDVVADFGYNSTPTTPGAGSAVFLHSWRKPRHPTEGCIAFAPDDLVWILETCCRFDRLVIKP